VHPRDGDGRRAGFARQFELPPGPRRGRDAGRRPPAGRPRAPLRRRRGRRDGRRPGPPEEPSRPVALGRPRRGRVVPRRLPARAVRLRRPRSAAAGRPPGGPGRAGPGRGRGAAGRLVGAPPGRVRAGQERGGARRPRPRAGRPALAGPAAGRPARPRVPPGRRRAGQTATPGPARRLLPPPRSLRGVPGPVRHPPEPRTRRGVAVLVPPGGAGSVFGVALDRARAAIRDAGAGKKPPKPRPALCRGCPHGRPYRISPEGDQPFTAGGIPLPLVAARGLDGHLYHSHCGDRFGETPPHEQAVRLGLRG